jgi:hypothetical protein
MKNQVRAIRRLAGAAEAFGLGRDIGLMKPEGAAEVRQAASAFNRMQDRIRRFVGQRTDMLAGISHDLRTPLTRMRLALAMLPRAPEAEEDIAALTEDVEEMERMVASYLAFARGEAQEQTQPTDLSGIVRDVGAAGAAGRGGGGGGGPGGAGAAAAAGCAAALPGQSAGQCAQACAADRRGGSRDSARRDAGGLGAGDGG